MYPGLNELESLRTKMIRETQHEIEHGLNRQAAPQIQRPTTRVIARTGNGMTMVIDGLQRLFTGIPNPGKKNIFF